MAQCWRDAFHLCTARHAGDSLLSGHWSRSAGTQLGHCQQRNEQLGKFQTHLFHYSPLIIAFVCLQDTCFWEDGCHFANLGCRYLNHLNTSVIKTYYTDIEDAKAAVRRGDAWGAVYITENFTDAFTARAALGRDSDDETIEQSEVKVWLDMSNQQIGVMLNRDIQLAYRDFAMGLLGQCGNNPKLGDVPIQFREPIYGTMNPSFTDFVAPGVILT